MSYKLGSLFDGSGGFPLAGSLCGIEPRWAAEVEPYPVAVTRSRFPNMKHMGDVSKVNGAEIEPVDIITFGSPCQDLSVAGKRAGLKHTENGDDETTRSGLFMEAVRIIKEMREATNGVYPRFALWENVPGAFSSNKGEDFRTVLAELIKIVEPDAVMLPVPKAGWPYSDSYCGDEWSLAYRVFDAQYWGVPQRRRRIHLVADFAGECAGKILFEREGLRGYFDAGGTPGEGAAADAERGPTAADCPGVGLDIYNLAVTGEIAASLTTATGQGASNTGPSVMVAAGFKAGNGAKAAGIGWQKETAPTLSAAPSGTNQAPAVLVKTWDARGNGDGNVCGTITGDHERRITDYSNSVMASGQGKAEITGNVVPTLNCNHEQPIVFDKEVYNSGLRANGGHYIAEGGPSPTLRGTGHAPGVCVRYIVRRLTPTECARLQGFPDNWGHPDRKKAFTDEEYRFWLEVRNTHAAINGKTVKDYTPAQMLTWYNKLHTDSAEYKMWGNGIALPPALYCMQGIVDVLKKEEAAEK